VTGFDNCEQAEAEGLTTVDIPNYRRGYIAAQSLIENIPGMNNNEILRIPVAVVWRNSVSV
jgi:LacI family transcriptional regulator